MRASVLYRHHLIGCLAAAALLGACVSPGSPLSTPSPASCGGDCKQVMLAMAYTANLSGSINLGTDPNVNTLQRVTATTTNRVNYALSTIDVLDNNWTTVWGPVVVLKPNNPPPPPTQPAQVPANTVFVAKQNGANVYVIAIAGTNPPSLFDWNDEDLDANPILWPGTYAYQGIRVTKGTLTGLEILQGMQSGGSSVTLYELLKGIAANQATIYITGHSLGGALAPALGLWLAEQQSDWDPSSNTTLQVYSFAGATPGDQKFAEYVYKKFPGGAGQNNMVVVDNALDVVPHAFNLQNLEQLDTLYLQNPQTCQPNSTSLICIYPGTAEQQGIQTAIDKVKKASSYGISFAKLGEGSQVQGFTGGLKSTAQLATGLDCALLQTPGLDDYEKEAIYQHICAYPAVLGPTTLDASLQACRAKYPTG